MQGKRQKTSSIRETNLAKTLKDGVLAVRIPKKGTDSHVEAAQSSLRMTRRPLLFSFHAFILGGYRHGFK